MSVTSCILIGNSGNQGGAVWTNGNAKIVGSTISNNTSVTGGGVDNLCTLPCGTSNFSGNSPQDVAGGYIDLGGNSTITV